MKSTFRLFIGLVIGTATLSLTVLLSGCGQPGPLYLPKPPAAKPAKNPGAPSPSALPSATPVPQQ